MAHIRHRLSWSAAGLRRAATTAGINLPVDFSQAVAGVRLDPGETLAVMALGHGVVIHTVDADDRHRRVIAWADRSGQWCLPPAAPATQDTPSAAVGRGEGIRR